MTRTLRRTTTGAEGVVQCSLPPQIEEMVLFACGLWIESGHDIHNYQFVSNILRLFLDDARNGGSLGSNECLLTAQLHDEFIESHPELKTKVMSAKKKKKPKANYRQWLSLVEGPIKRILPATGYRIFSARELGLVIEKTRYTRAASVQRPRNADKDRRKVTSAIYLISMAGEFYPPHIMMRNDEELPTDYQELGGFKVASNRTGWANRQDWLNWLVNEFDPATQRHTEGGPQWRILFVDSYYSPIKEEFFVECFKRGILCVAYPTWNAVDKLDPFSCGEIFYDVDRIYKAWLQDQWENRGVANCLSIRREEFIRGFAEIVFGQGQNGKWEAQTVQAWQKSLMFPLLSPEPAISSQIPASAVTQVPESQPVAENRQRDVESDSVIACESQHNDGKSVGVDLDYEDRDYESVLAEVTVDNFNNDMMEYDMEASTPRSRKRSLERSTTPDAPRSYQRPRCEPQEPPRKLELPIRTIQNVFYSQSSSSASFSPKIETPELSPPPPPSLSHSIRSHDPPDSPGPSQTVSARENIRQAYHCVAETIFIIDSDAHRKKTLGMMADLVDKLAITP